MASSTGGSELKKGMPGMVASACPNAVPAKNSGKMKPPRKPVAPAAHVMHEMGGFAYFTGKKVPSTESSPVELPVASGKSDNRSCAPNPILPYHASLLPGHRSLR